MGFYFPECREARGSFCEPQFAAFNACEWLERRTCGTSTSGAVAVLRVYELVGYFVFDLATQALPAQRAGVFFFSGVAHWLPPF